MSGHEAVRSVLREIPKGASTSTGAPPRPGDVYALPEHAAAIDPDVSLVVGNRGMGKTFWATVLEQTETRNEIAEKFLGSRGSMLRDFSVFFGFADDEGAKGVSGYAIKQLSDLEPESIWRGLLIHSLAEQGLVEQISFDSAARLADSDPERARNILRNADTKLSRDGRRVLMLFDQLDRLPGDWREIQRLTKGLLRLALAAKSYRNIRLKIFMRSDQEADDDLFSFPDASKIRGEQAKLGWQARNLYGLLFYILCKNRRAEKQVLRYCADVGVNNVRVHTELGIPWSLAVDERSQGVVFDLIAGTMMGNGTKRGRPYTWIPTHLADGRSEISPRSFLTAIRVAAEHFPRIDPNLIFDFHGIQAGVSEASINRLSELKQDYPWIADALDPLHGMTVPSEKSNVFQNWKEQETTQRILSRHKDSRAPIELVLTHDSSGREQSLALVNALINTGVFEARADNKINVPDIFRIDAGMKRRGGITPQQRRRI